MTPDDSPSGPLDVAAMDAIAQRASDHPLVADRSFCPDGISPRRLRLSLDETQYPGEVDAAKIDVRWYEGGDYTFHYVEQWGDERWQCRWDRHPKPDAPRKHFHPPPDAGTNPETSPIDDTHHLDATFAVLDWIASRIRDIHGT